MLAAGPRLLVALALVGGLAGPAAADYRQSYLDGVRALRRGAWEEAARLLAEAARERPVEQARARLVGAIPEPYLPHHYLGLAHFQRRRCAEALAEWSISAEQGAVKSLPALAAEAERSRQGCEGLARAEAAVAAARSPAARLAAPEVAPALGRDPALDGRRRQAQASLAAAEEELAKAKQAWNFEEMARLAERAEAAAAELEAVATEVASRLEEARRASGEEAPGPAQAAASVAEGATAEREAEAAAPTEGARPSPPPAGGGAGAAAGAPATAAGGPPPAAAAPAPRSPVAPPEPLAEPYLAAIQAFFDGRYQRALDLFQALPAPASVAERFVTSLFRAAARHALYLLGGEEDAALLASAVQDLRAARRADPAFTPRPDHFSPRFIAFFRDHS
jgi:hypothetical protein